MINNKKYVFLNYKDQKVTVIFLDRNIPSPADDKNTAVRISTSLRFDRYDGKNTNMTHKQGIDFNLIPSFTGNGKEDANQGLTCLQLLVQTNGVNGNKAKPTMPLLLTDNALCWYISLPEDTKTDYELLNLIFIQRYGPGDRTKWQRTASLFQTAQRSSNVKDYIASVNLQASDLGLPDAQVQSIIINGLRPTIRQFELQHILETLESLIQSAILSKPQLKAPSNKMQ
ncbi:hypothetical protein CHS0354_030502 [Potamilus streckersoni]|uniref:Retrotransposon gag domain-containing protein n=1 Tax=Potamilus streckersoni TaxID=2493646 RepID=A0AAE0RPG7_9BIVA|nr:hypothetical protein CHS0354_030502 [Potamilus streckersoni]